MNNKQKNSTPDSRQSASKNCQDSCYKNIPNCITAVRIIGTVCLLFVSPLSVWFYIIYSLTGVTDVLDGFLARKLGVSSKSGAVLDSIADLLFYGVMLLRIFPVLWKVVPVELWYAVIGVLIVRCLSYIVVLVRYRLFSSIHTYLNKLTGAAVFVIPYIISLSFSVYLLWIICAIGAISSTEELLIHILEKTYCGETKSLLNIYRQKSNRPSDK